MYAVVGCNECANMWLLKDPQSSETASCSRCGKTHRTVKLKRFFESTDRSAAQQARSALLAKKHGDSEAFAEVAHVADLEERIETAGVDDREYLEGSGLDADEVFAAGERVGPGGGGKGSNGGGKGSNGGGKGSNGGGKGSNGGGKGSNGGGSGRNGGSVAGGSRSRTGIVRDAVEAAEEPTADSIVAYATDHGVPAEAARGLLEKLTRRGEVSESRGRYRLL